MTVGSTLAWAPLVAPAESASASAAARLVAPSHSLSIGGPGVAAYPAFSPDVRRYAATTTEESDGTLVLDAQTSDPTGTVLVDGVPATGATTVSGLREGEEVSVLVLDDAGTSAYSVVYLPPDFPTMEVTVPAAEHSRMSDGAVLLTLNRWVAPGAGFEVALDRNGVPLWLHRPEHGRSMDLRALPGGGYSVFRRPSDDPGGSAEAVLLDPTMAVVGTRTTVGLQHTDAHDVVWNDDGSFYISAYEPDPDSGLVDAVVQHVGIDGSVLWEWSSADHDLAEETVTPEDPDYAHLNSIQVMDDGDLLLSFRHLSAILKVARSDRAGISAGDIVWRLGGRRSDFTFPDDPAGTGPCAQHTAYQQPDGRIVVFDNGSWTPSTPLCVDQEDALGPVVQRPVTRVIDLVLDEETMEASIASDLRVEERFAVFAGSAERLDGGSTLVGWAASTPATASELGPDGEVLWEVRNLATDSGPAYFTYRAAYADFPDATSPEVHVGPDAGRPIRLGAGPGVLHRCTDRGGSGLASCTTPAGPPSTTEPGAQMLEVVATDGAGNRTRAEVPYVVADSRADTWVRAASVTTGRDVLGGPVGRQSRTARVAGRAVATFGMDHEAAVADRLAVRVRLRGDTGSFRLRWRADGRDVGSRVAHDRFRPRVRADRKRDLRLVAVPRASAVPGDRLRVMVQARQDLGSGARDRVQLRLVLD